MWRSRLSRWQEKRAERGHSARGPVSRKLPQWRGKKTAMRRILDIALALVILPMVSPLFLLAMVAVVVESPGNPFYGGWRVGKGGKKFRMWEFCTMKNGAGHLGKAITPTRDPRITQ